MDTATILTNLNKIYKMNRERVRPILPHVEKVKSLLNNSFHFNLGDCSDNIKHAKFEINKQIKLPFPVVLLTSKLRPRSETDRDFTSCILMEWEYATQFFGKKFEYSDGIIKSSAIYCLPLVQLDRYHILPFGAIAEIPTDTTEELEAQGGALLHFEIMDEATVTMFMEHGRAEMQDIYLSEIITARYFLKLLTCKNVEVREGTAKPVSRLLRKKGDPVVKEKDIVIKLPGKGIKYQEKTVTEIRFQDLEKHGITGQKRGHFKTFTEEAPLFGKHVGTWWWSPIFGTNKRHYQVETGPINE